MLFQYFGSHDKSMTIGKFFTDGYCLFVDFRSTPDNVLHSSGRRFKNTSDGITLHITKKRRMVQVTSNAMCLYCKMDNSILWMGVLNLLAIDMHTCKDRVKHAYKIDKSSIKLTGETQADSTPYHKGPH